MTSVRADLPSGKVPTTRVRLRISRFRRSIALLVRMRHQCSRGRVRQGLGEALADDPGRLPEPHPVELLRDLEGHDLGSAARLHGVDRPEPAVQRVFDRLLDQFA